MKRGTAWLQDTYRARQLFRRACRRRKKEEACERLAAPSNLTHLKEGQTDEIRLMSAILFCAAALLAAARPRRKPRATEIKGAAILDHPCGKVAVKHMGLVHAGKMDEATKLGNQGCRTTGKTCRPTIAR